VKEAGLTKENLQFKNLNLCDKLLSELKTENKCEYLKVLFEIIKTLSFIIQKGTIS
jgi:hypothetical protein